MRLRIDEACAFARIWHSPGMTPSTLTPEDVEHQITIWLPVVIFAVTAIGGAVVTIWSKIQGMKEQLASHQAQIQANALAIQSPPVVLVPPVTIDPAKQVVTTITAPISKPTP